MASEVREEFCRINFGIATKPPDVVSIKKPLLIEDEGMVAQ
ncbi:MAG: hypothetical protein QGI80_02120 [archaeon]|jgi:hypothetical protein|nr:hypothetical protein [archaeon]